jgi:hypothetical protein
MARARSTATGVALEDLLRQSSKVVASWKRKQSKRAVPRVVVLLLCVRGSARVTSEGCGSLDRVVVSPVSPMFKAESEI